MDSIELLYVNFLEHAFLKGLEINFSQTVGFRLNDRKELEVNDIDSINIFEKSIVNLNVIVGKNGVGKTTIINTIYEALHGSVRKDLLLVIRKNQEIIVYVEDSDITISNNISEKIFNEYTFKTHYEGFIFEVVPYFERNEDYIQQAVSIIYISDFIDSSINSSSHRFENNHALNFSPFALINSPDSFLDYNHFFKRNLKKNTSNFIITSKIHQIEFISNNSLFDFSTEYAGAERAC